MILFFIEVYKFIPVESGGSGVAKRIVSREVCCITCAAKGARLLKTLLEKGIHKPSQVESYVTELFPMLVCLKISELSLPLIVHLIHLTFLEQIFAAWYEDA